MFLPPKFSVMKKKDLRTSPGIKQSSNRYLRTSVHDYNNKIATTHKFIFMGTRLKWNNMI